MTTKYNRNTLVTFGTLSNYSVLYGGARERMEALIDPKLLTLTEEESNQREYPLHAYTRAVAFGNLDYASVIGDGKVLIREAAFTPGKGGMLLLRTSGGGFSKEVPPACATSLLSLLGETLDGVHYRDSYEIIDVYQAPRSGRFYVALARKED